MPLDLNKILYNIPEVKKPLEKRLSFNTKLKWTLIILLAFFVLANISIYGVTSNFLTRFEYLELIMGTDFGSIITLGISPIVMSSIILQLLVGAKILDVDLKTEDGKKYFQGLQKLGVIFFIIFEALVYVLMGGIQAAPGNTLIVILQIMLGGVAIVYMDEVVQKWGFGSGVSLFIVAGVAWRLFNGLFQFLGTAGQNCLSDFTNTPCSVNLLVILQSVINGAPKEALTAIVTILVTAIVFLIVVWEQNLKIEVPLTYERLRGYSVKWPLAFFYASVIPVILVSALSANIQLLGSLLENKLGHATFLGGFSQGQPISGLAFWLSSPNIPTLVIHGGLGWTQILQGIIHLSFYMIFSAVFAVFWVKTSGMDESSQAKNILSSGLQIPGFRKDPRVLEAILNRYIWSLTIMGGLAIGALAALADMMGALTSGTAILLAVMIIYQLYQGIAQQHALDMHPALKKIMKA